MADSKKIADVTSTPRPQTGQQHRSSGNFSCYAHALATNVRFEIRRDNPKWNSITFNVKDDKGGGGKDPVVFTAV